MNVQSEHKRDLWKPENEQILSTVATHPQWSLLGSNAKQNSDWLACMGHSKFHTIPGGIDTTMSTYLHVSRREVNQNPVTNPGLKQGLVVLAAQAYQYVDETIYYEMGCSTGVHHHSL